jgi:hypothetical protein
MPIPNNPTHYFCKVLYVVFCFGFYACETTNDIAPEQKQSLSREELRTLVQYIPEYQSMITLMPQHQLQIRNTLGNLSAEQKSRWSALYAAYHDPNDFLSNGSKDDVLFFHELITTIFTDDLSVNRKLLLTSLSRYALNYRELTGIVSVDIRQKNGVSGRAMDTTCAEVYQQIYWEQVDYWFTFMEQNEILMTAEEIDMRAGTSASWAYVGCIMGGGQ